MNNHSHWATQDEIKKRLKEISSKDTLDQSGIPLFYQNNSAYIDDSDMHNLIIGSTGSGKTQAFILPMISLSKKAHESMIINDPYGELYKVCASNLQKDGYQTIALDFNKGKYGNNWNPLLLIYDYYKSGEHDLALRLIEDLGYYLFYDQNKDMDPFWTNTTIDYFTGLVLYLFENATKEEINILSVYSLNNQIKEPKNLEDFLSNIKKDSDIYYNLAGTLEAPSETKGSILSVFNQKIKKYISRKNFINMLCNDDFSINQLYEKPTAVFLISGESDYANSLIPLFISHVIECASKRKEKKRMNLLLDEFDSMVPIKNFSSMIQYCRTISIRFTITIKSYAHLNYIYGEENAKLLRYCFGNIIYLLSEDIPTVEEFSKYCGTIKESGKEMPLISVEELRTLNTFEAVISMIRMKPIKTKLIPFYKMKWEDSQAMIDIPIREEKEIKEYKN